jgi:hypothetical protein
VPVFRRVPCDRERPVNTGSGPPSPSVTAGGRFVTVERREQIAASRRWSRRPDRLIGLTVE